MRKQPSRAPPKKVIHLDQSPLQHHATVLKLQLHSWPLSGNCILRNGRGGLLSHALEWQDVANLSMFAWQFQPAFAFPVMSEKPC